MSSNIIINGKNAAIRQPDSYRFDPVRGWQTIIRFRGPKDKILARAPEFSSTGCTVDIFSNNGAVWELNATSPTALDGSTEAPVNIWESSTNIVAKDICNLAQVSSDLTAVDIAAVRKAVAAANAAAADFSAPPAVPFTGAKLHIYTLMLYGETTIAVYQPIIRHTQVVSNSYAVVTARTNVGSIISTDLVGAPSNFLIGLPNSGASSRAAVGGYGWIFGWLKKPATVQTAAYNKLQIAQDFEFGEYSRYTHGNLVS